MRLIYSSASKLRTQIRLPISFGLNSKLIDLAGEAPCNVATADLNQRLLNCPPNTDYDLVVLLICPQLRPTWGAFNTHQCQALSQTRTSGGGHPSFFKTPQVIPIVSGAKNPCGSVLSLCHLSWPTPLNLQASALSQLGVCLLRKPSVTLPWSSPWQDWLLPSYTCAPQPTVSVQ